MSEAIEIMNAFFACGVTGNWLKKILSLKWTSLIDRTWLITYKSPETLFLNLLHFHFHARHHNFLPFLFQPDHLAVLEWICHFPTLQCCLYKIVVLLMIANIFFLKNNSWIEHNIENWNVKQLSNLHFHYFPFYTLVILEIWTSPPWKWLAPPIVLLLDP